jgi:hypothetical protein
MRRSMLVGVLAVSAFGCQRWQVDWQALAAPQPERRGLQIWSQRHSTLVHGVQLIGDSVRVVSYWQSPSCDSCARWLPRSAIDSVRVRTTDDLRTALAVGLSAVLLVLGLLFYNELQSLKT